MDSNVFTNSLTKSQIDIILSLIQNDLADNEIANKLIEMKEINLIYDDVYWEEIDIKNFKKEYDFTLKKMKVCPNCGNNVNEKALICRFCKNGLNNVNNNDLKKGTAITQSSIQKFSLLGLLILFSLMFHIIFCEWNPPYYEKIGILKPGPIFSFGEFESIRVYASDVVHNNIILGLILGILLPFFLIATSIYLYAGWHKDIKPIFNYLKLKLQSLWRVIVK